MNATLNQPAASDVVSGEPSAGTADRAEAAHNRRAWPLVANREIQVHLTDRNFIMSTLVTVVILIATFGFQAYMANRSHHFDVAVSSPAAEKMVKAAAATPLAVEKRTTLTTVVVSDETAATQAVRDGRADAVLAFDGTSWRIIGDKSPEDSLRDAVTAAVNASVLADIARAAGSDSATLQKRMTVDYTLLNQSMKDATALFVTTFVFAMLFYISSLLFGINVANSVVQEKQSRMVEIIAATIPLRQLLVGKMVGMMVLAFAQMILYIGVGMIGLSFTTYKHLVPTVSQGAGWFILFFVIGFAALSSLWAMAGSLASRAEDVGSTSAPISMSLMAIFYLGLFGSGTVLKVASFVPIASSIAMPRRILEGGVSWWEPLTALAITVAFAYGVLRFSSAVYQRALMQTGGKLSIRKALAVEN